MKTNPGIFIHVLSADINMYAFVDYFHFIARALEYDKERFAQKLSNASVEASLYTACKISLSEKSIRFGLFLKLAHPHQMEYKKVMQLINYTTLLKLSEYTIPIANVQASGLGVITKSVYAFIKCEDGAELGFEFKKNIELLLSVLKKQNSISNFITELVLAYDGENGFEIHGTSPVQKESNSIAFVWQNYMGKAFKVVAPMVTPMFTQTWSTNKELTEYFTGKGREISQEKQIEYKKYSKGTCLLKD